MSVTIRWILAVLVFLLSLGAAAFTVFGGAFSTVACVQLPPDRVYYLLIVVGVLILTSGTAAVALIIRKERLVRAAFPAALGILLMCGGLVAYFALLGQYC